MRQAAREEALCKATNAAKAAKPSDGGEPGAAAGRGAEPCETEKRDEDVEEGVEAPEEQGEEEAPEDDEEQQEMDQFADQKEDEDEKDVS